MSIVTLTVNPTIDTSTTAHQVIAERKIRCDEPTHEPGGGGINVARAIKKLGHSAVAWFPVGGTNGELLLQLLHNEQIETKTTNVSGMTRENITVRETSSERQFRFVMPGPEFAEDEWRACLQAIDNIDPAPQYLAASGSLPRGVPDDFYAQLSEIAERRGSRMIVDTSGEPLRKVLERPVFMIKPNVRELTDLMDMDVESEIEIEDAARKMLKQCGCQNIVVSLGSGGALVLTNGDTTHLRAPTVPIKSKVGAGDSMVAGTIVHLAGGASLIEAVTYGVAAGASAVMTPGSELCRHDTTERLFAQLQKEHGEDKK